MEKIVCKINNAIIKMRTKIAKNSAAKLYDELKIKTNSTVSPIARDINMAAKFE